RIQGPGLALARALAPQGRDRPPLPGALSVNHPSGTPASPAPTQETTARPCRGRVRCAHHFGYRRSWRAQRALLFLRRRPEGLEGKQPRVYLLAAGTQNGNLG